MRQKQKQTLESFVRVRAFVDAHPVTGPLGYGGVPETLDEVVRRLREHAGAQLTGRERSRGEIRRQRQLVQQLIDRHIRPIVAIARAQRDPGSEVRMPASIRMPHAGIGVTRILQASDGLIEAARPFEATFIAHGLPADFLARFIAARDALASVLGVRGSFVGAHVAARTGLAVQLRRGRRAVERIDSVVRASFDDDEMTLAAWRAAKRIHLVGGRTAERGTDDGQPQAA